MKNYDHKKIEKKWQKEWEKKKIYQVKNNSRKKEFYGLIEFPYPSGAGLHVGHIRSNTAMDIISRKRRMEEYNVLYPIGWDAFGLPTENYAIKTGISPEKVTKQNTDIFRKQLKSLGFSFDWSSEINTTDPEYYKWTQWIFLQMFKKGLAYKQKSNINWCPSCKIGLANEEAQRGVCERCGSKTIKKEKEQWMLAITKYADRLDKDLDLVDYPERIKIQQRNWIGKSEGSEIEFKITTEKLKNSSAFALGDIRQGTHGSLNSLVSPLGIDLGSIKVFTTRADTLFGATYVVLSPEHSLVEKLKVENKEEVEKYVSLVKKKTDLERTENKEKTGIELKGIKAINPVNGEEIPIWIADYVLSSYGTGAVMAVPAHDERDFEFAKKYNLPIIDKPLVDAKEITKEVGGKMVTKYKLRDWVFSRQRYWGEPIPLVNCDKCGWVPVSEKSLPVVLPKVKSYQPTDNGESPLALIKSWVNTTCPCCKGKAKRETDTMPNWAGSSWYFLRYVDPKNKKEFASKKNLKYFTPVDWYNGGMEHTTLHLLYSRFWHKFLYDLKLVPSVEPYSKRTSHGMILGEDGEKMSKSKGNTINPDEIVKIYGADTLRLYEMFLGPFDQVVSWNTDSIIGPRRFLEKVWRISLNIKKVSKSSLSESLSPRARGALTLGSSACETPTQANFETLKKLLHKTIKKVGDDIENMHFNTAISSMMILATEMESFVNKGGKIDKEDFLKFLKILSPFAPYITEELWFNFGNKKSIHISSWPSFDFSLIKENNVKIVVQINGKLKEEMLIPVSIEEEEVKKLVLQNEKIKNLILNKEIKRIIYVKDRIVNIVI